MTGAWRSRRGQGGQSLVEVLVAVTLIALVAVTVAGSLLAVTRITEANEQLGIVDAALVGYGEVIRTQLAAAPTDPVGWGLDADGYRDCASGTAAAYQADANRRIGTLPDPASASTTVSTTTPIASVAWRKPPNADMTVSVLSVVNWNSNTESWAAGCISPDPGIQRVEIQVTYRNPNQIAPQETKTAMVVKRRPGPAT